MGSTFTATMKDTGIVIPEVLKDVAKVYYTENGEATQDLSNSSNGWTETPSDFSKVKSYLVDLGTYILSKDEKENISYDISIPEGLSYNEVSYSHHAVYFSLDTEEGKYRTSTEPNKVGYMIARQYDLEITKYQKGKDKIVEGATYAVYEEGSEETKTQVTYDYSDYVSDTYSISYYKNYIKNSNSFYKGVNGVKATIKVKGNKVIYTVDIQYDNKYMKDLVDAGLVSTNGSYKDIEYISLQDTLKNQENAGLTCKEK